jgi:hypothetical protein
MWSDTITALYIVTLHLLGLRCCWTMKWSMPFYGHGGVNDDDDDDNYEIYNLNYVG